MTAQKVTKIREDREAWMITRSGIEFELLSPTDEMINMDDISWGLSGCHRFNGQTRRFRYTSAQHACMAHYAIVENPDIYPDWLAAYALLHDASDAYIPDFHPGLKDAIPGFKLIEKQIMDAISKRYGLRRWDEAKPMIKGIDLRLLATEKRDLCSHSKRPWKLLEGIEPYEWHIVPWAAEVARREFLDRWMDLSLRMVG